MHKYVINDVWMALKLSFKNFWTLLLIIWLPLIASGLFFETSVLTTPYGEAYLKLAQVLTVIVLIQSIIIYFANRRYIIDLDSGWITFPRSDIENSLIAIILLFPYWNLVRTKTIHANEIENLYLDTKRWTTTHKVANGTGAKGKTKYKSETKRHVRYTINIAGTFGSANLQFLDRQKRDEVRNALEQCLKQVSGRQIDKKVAEFGE